MLSISRYICFKRTISIGRRNLKFMGSGDQGNGENRESKFSTRCLTEKKQLENFRNDRDTERNRGSNCGLIYREGFAWEKRQRKGAGNRPKLSVTSRGLAGGSMSPSSGRR